MPSTNLDNLVKINQLKNEPGDQTEFDGLIASAKPRLADAKNKSLSLESRFDLTYNAAHSLSLAALRWNGYRSENRYMVFQCVQHTLGMSAPKWRILEDAHRKRNNAEYSGIVDIQESVVKALIEVTEEILALVSKLGKLKARQ